ncbi:hypothetical protein ACES2L_04560 [Bdellovibrio bacteriovorus]
MKKFIVAALVSFMSVSAFAQNTHLICMTGDVTDMDIKIETAAGKEKLSVILTAMDGETVTSYVNSNITSKLASGTVNEVVSTSDLQDSFGGAYLDAGLLNMTRTNGGEYKVNFAAKGLVITATCR